MVGKQSHFINLVPTDLQISTSTLPYPNLCLAWFLFLLQERTHHKLQLYEARTVEGQDR